MSTPIYKNTKLQYNKKTRQLILCLFRIKITFPTQTLVRKKKYKKIKWGGRREEVYRMETAKHFLELQITVCSFFSPLNPQVVGGESEKCVKVYYSFPNKKRGLTPSPWRQQSPKTQSGVDAVPHYPQTTVVSKSDLSSILLALTISNSLQIPSFIYNTF